MNSQVAKNIRRYAKLRGAEDMVDSFKRTYEKADEETRKRYREEMQKHFDVQNRGVIGQSTKQQHHTISDQSHVMRSKVDKN